MFAGKKSAQIREILISESAWEEMTCLFAPSLEILCHSSNMQSKRNDTCPNPSISTKRLKHSSLVRH
ncbi:hypothetical protein GBT17_25290 [Escherichia coli]|nr:hypothetical protein [Escherichia coli]